LAFVKCARIVKNDDMLMWMMVVAEVMIVDEERDNDESED
jgi:hypothetical protein